MFEYFPENYLWSLNTMLVVSMGGEMSEIEDACAPLRQLDAHDPTATSRWYESWSALGARLERLAAEDRRAGNLLSSNAKEWRATAYRMAAERILPAGHEEKLPAYDRYLAAFARGAEDLGNPVERIDVPFGDSVLPSLYVPAADPSAPTLVLLNGLDGTKELIHLCDQGAFSARGVSLLIVDQPGVGGALRHHGLHARHDAEVPSAAAIDYLETRSDVDPNRIGVIGISLGGYYASRAAAFEKRFRCAILWGACWDLPKVLEHLYGAETHTVQTDSHLPWVFGVQDDALQAKLDQFRVAPFVDRIECPFLVVHGDNDRQVPLEQAQATYDGAVNAERRQLLVFTGETGGNEHCQIDNIKLGTHAMADWAARTLAGSAG